MNTVTIARGKDCCQVYDVDENAPISLTVRDWVTLNIGGDFLTPMLCLYQSQPLLREQWDVTLIEADVVFVAFSGPHFATRMEQNSSEKMKGFCSW